MTEVKIDSLRLKVPRLSREQASELGRSVGERLLLRLPELDRDIELGHLNLRLRLERGESISHLADRIAARIAEATR